MKCERCKTALRKRDALYVTDAAGGRAGPLCLWCWRRQQTRVNGRRRSGRDVPGQPVLPFEAGKEDD